MHEKYFLKEKNLYILYHLPDYARGFHTVIYGWRKFYCPNCEQKNTTPNYSCCTQRKQRMNSTNWI